MYLRLHSKKPLEANDDRNHRTTNKALVLEAFDTLFNKRDYVAAEKLWSRTMSSIARISRRGVRAYSV